MDFSSLNLSNELQEAVSFMGFTKTTPIQEFAIPVIMKGRDLIASAQTGTGKTAAFVLPLLDMINKDNTHKKVKALIVVPTRELALQIDRDIQGISYFLPVTSLPVYGGGDGSEWTQERKALTEGVDIVIATPGKLLAHIKLGYVDFSRLQYYILDEADKMLDMGFYDDIMRITNQLPKKRQTMMFSATMPPKIKQMAQQLLNNPEEININLSKPAEGVLQAAYPVHDKDKIRLISHLLKDKLDYKRILIFTATKVQVNEIVRSLNKMGMNAHGISSDFAQSERQDILNRFKAARIRILVATDVLSRGIDIKNIDIIINYEVPRDAEDYVHRVGRTARAEQSGIALTLVNPTQMGDFEKIEKLIEQTVRKQKLPFAPDKTPAWNVTQKHRHHGKPRNKSFHHKKKNSRRK
ncbi:MAG: DEAD/DEAH box helicase [Candidatus Delongbacteria bacterium]|jgi:superfamily II DNA/RNA helicase|nr:DEAD/DEAH box helicase [Candidatus Delongbacteria bacterium]